MLNAKGEGMSDEQQDPPEINENIRALCFECCFRRYGVIFLSIVIICSLSGLFSSGFLSSVHKTNTPATLSLDYERFARLMSETEINIQVRNRHSPRTTIDFSSSLLVNYQIGDIRPQPDKMYSANGHLNLVYDGNTSGAPLTIWLSITPKTFGKFINAIQVNQQPAVTFNQFVFP